MSSTITRVLRELNISGDNSYEYDKIHIIVNKLFPGMKKVEINRLLKKMVDGNYMAKTVYPNQKPVFTILQSTNNTDNDLNLKNAGDPKYAKKMSLLTKLIHTSKDDNDVATAKIITHLITETVVQESALLAIARKSDPKYNLNETLSQMMRSGDLKVIKMVNSDFNLYYIPVAKLLECLDVRDSISDGWEHLKNFLSSKQVLGGIEKASISIEGIPKNGTQCVYLSRATVESKFSENGVPGVVGSGIGDTISDSMSVCMSNMHIKPMPFK